MDWWITNNQNLFTTINQRLPDPLPDLERSPNGHGTIGSCRSPRPQCLVRAFTAQAVTIILARHRQRQSTPRSQRSQRGYETCIPREQLSRRRYLPQSGYSDKRGYFIITSTATAAPLSSAPIALSAAAPRSSLVTRLSGACRSTARRCPRLVGRGFAVGGPRGTSTQ